MAIITLSRGSYSLGHDVAEATAGKLGFRCIARAVLEDAERTSGIPAEEFAAVFVHPPPLLERFSHAHRRHEAHLRAALLAHCKADNVVYDGPLAHHLLSGVSHLVRVHVLADPEVRVAQAMERDELSETGARAAIDESDRAEQGWARCFHDQDPTDPEEFDLVVHVGNVTAEYAADLICSMVRLPSFATTTEGQASINDLALAACVEAVLIDTLPELAEVRAYDGQVVVTVHPQRIHGGTSAGFSEQVTSVLERRLERLLREVKGIKSVVARVGR